MSRQQSLFAPERRAPAATRSGPEMPHDMARKREVFTLYRPGECRWSKGCSPNATPAEAMERMLRCLDRLSHELVARFGNGRIELRLRADEDRPERVLAEFDGMTLSEATEALSPPRTTNTRGRRR